MTISNLDIRDDILGKSILVNDHELGYSIYQKPQLGDLSSRDGTVLQVPFILTGVLGDEGRYFGLVLYLIKVTADPEWTIWGSTRVPC